MLSHLCWNHCAPTLPPPDSVHWDKQQLIPKAASLGMYPMSPGLGHQSSDRSSLKLRLSMGDADILLTASAGLPQNSSAWLKGGDGFASKIIPIPLQLWGKLRDISRIPNWSNLGHKDFCALSRAGRTTQPLSSGKEHLLIQSETAVFTEKKKENMVAFFTLSHWIFKLKISQFSKKAKKKKKNITRQGINRNYWKYFHRIF